MNIKFGNVFELFVLQQFSILLEYPFKPGFTISVTYFKLEFDFKIFHCNH